MIHRRLKLLLILLCGNSQLSVGFNSFLPKTTTPQLVSLSSSTTTFGRNKRPVLHASSKGFGSGSKAAKGDESKKEFNKALTELQNDGVPLLACDADQVHTLNAALWTTMAEMSDNNLDQKTCLVLEKIPLDALKAFTEDYVILKNQIRLIEHLPELQRISVSLVGNGAGPAILLETSRRTQEEIDEKESRAKRAEGKMNEASCTKALKKFVERMVIGEEACPYTKTVDIAATGLEARGITPGPVAYRFSDTIDVCGALASFWTSVCELLSFPESEISTTVLSLPGIGAGTEKEDHERFAAIVELVSRNLCLFRGDSVFGLVHFHPCYDRNLIGPVHKAAYGHLPPRPWLRPMFNHMGNEKGASLSDDELNLSDYQRRAPHTAINILRVNQLNAASGAKSIVELDIGVKDEEGNAVIEKASGLSTYTRNAMRLAGIGKESLQAALEEEILMSNSAA